MLAIILTILKIIGIVILSILGILLLMLLCALFVPIRYEIKGKKQEAWMLSAKVFWLLHVITVRFRYSSEGDKYGKVKVFGIPIFNLFAEKKERRKEKSSSRKTGKKKKSGPAADIGKERPEKATDIRKEKLESATADIENKEKPEPVAAGVENKAVRQEQELNEAPSDPDKKPKKRFLTRIFDLCRAVIDFFKKIIEKIRNIKYTLNRAKETAAYYINVLKMDVTKKALSKLKLQAGKLLKHCKPKKFSVNLLIGTEDPYSLGQLLAIYGMLFPLIGNNVNVVPDFDNVVFQGDLYIKGRITAFVMLRIAWKVLYDRDIRKVYRLLIQEEV